MTAVVVLQIGLKMPLFIYGFFFFMDNLRAITAFEKSSYLRWVLRFVSVVKWTYKKEPNAKLAKSHKGVYILYNEMMKRGSVENILWKKNDSSSWTWVIIIHGVPFPANVGLDYSNQRNTGAIRIFGHNEGGN